MSPCSLASASGERPRESRRCLTDLRRKERTVPRLMVRVTRSKGLSETKDEWSGGGEAGVGDAPAAPASEPERAPVPAPEAAAASRAAPMTVFAAGGSLLAERLPVGPNCARSTPNLFEPLPSVTRRPSVPPAPASAWALSLLADCSPERMMRPTRPGEVGEPGSRRARPRLLACCTFFFMRSAFFVWYCSSQVEYSSSAALSLASVSETDLLKKRRAHLATAESGLVTA